MHTTNRTLIDLDALATLFRHGVATVTELLHLGLSTPLLHRRCRRGGPWQRLLPGILLLSGSPPTRTQRVQAALRYAGANALLTGLDALHLHGIRTVPAAGPVHVLIPHRRQLDAPPDLRVTRTRDMPNPVLRNSFLTVPASRAVLDASRHLPPEAQRAVLAETIRAGTDPADLRPRGSPALQAALTAALLTAPTEVIAKAGLPTPRWHIPLRTSEGRPLGTADAWWNTLGLAWQFRSTPPRTLAAAGVLVVHTTPHQTSDAIAAQLRRAAAHATTRPRPEVIPG